MRVRFYQKHTHVALFGPLQQISVAKPSMAQPLLGASSARRRFSGSILVFPIFLLVLLYSPDTQFDANGACGMNIFYSNRRKLHTSTEAAHLRRCFVQVIRRQRPDHA